MLLSPQWPEPFGKFCPDISFHKSGNIFHMSWSFVQREFRTTVLMLHYRHSGWSESPSRWQHPSESSDRAVLYIIVLFLGQLPPWTGIISQFLLKLWWKNSWKNKQLSEWTLFNAIKEKLSVLGQYSAIKHPKWTSRSKQRHKKLLQTPEIHYFQ